MKKLIAFIMAVAGLTVYGQQHNLEFKRDLSAVNRNMGNIKKYSVIMKYSMFIDGKMDKPYSKKQVNICMDNDLYNMSEIDRVEVIETKNEYLMVDHRQKMVVLNRLKNQIKQNTADEDIDEYNQILDVVDENYDSLMTLATKITVTANNYPYKTYEVEYNRYCEYTKASYTIDVKNRLFKSLTVTYGEPEYVKGLDDREHFVTMKVDYENFRVDQPISQTVFDIGKFVEKSGGNKMVLKGTVKDYKLQIF